MTHHPWHRKHFASEAIADCKANFLAHLFADLDQMDPVGI